MSGYTHNPSFCTTFKMAKEEAFATIMATQKPNPWGRGHLQLYALAAVCFLNSTMSGFDSSLMGSINTLPNYTRYYNLPNTGTASTGIIFAIFQIGQMCAALFVWVADWLGRRWLIFIGTAGVVVGTVVTSTASTLPTFIGGRFLLSFFAQLACSASPLYLVEVAPPQYRGTLAGMYNTFYYFVCTLYACQQRIKLSVRPRVPFWPPLLSTAPTSTFRIQTWTGAFHYGFRWSALDSSAA